MQTKKKGLFLILLGVLLVVTDQVIKVLVKTNMTLGESIPVLGNWFQLLFVENKGMAFGMAFGGVVGKYLLTLFRLVLFGVLCWWISKLLKRGMPGQAGHDGKSAKGGNTVTAGTDRQSPVPMGVLVGLTLITAGALGNIIDCLCYGLIFSESTYSAVATLGHYAPFMQGRVVDMFFFPLFTWPDWVPGLGGHVFFEPVFNFADSCVTVGAFYLILFHWRFFAKDV